ncbi:hypothetical protein MGN70_007528 [Eutypa lata]|uniref:Uncharacterized protein n=1 Tax=Eutypa lata (strain UCR-EL1) TaxID=1287681 RepID=M7T760_EUTLA|nr:hypothetical protein UCREL1_218 [Eutypa lata UCREL1]KAI1250475.1 hypothetical protein MGN70_007528 [Eutypa lata]
MSARRVLVTLFSLVAAVTAIAENPIDACNCPNNCDYVVGTSCKFYASPNGAFGARPIATGSCVDADSGSSGQIWCKGSW